MRAFGPVQECVAAPAPEAVALDVAPDESVVMLDDASAPPPRAAAADPPAFDVYDASGLDEDEPPFDPPEADDPLGLEDCWSIDAPATPPAKAPPPPLRALPKAPIFPIMQTEARNLDYIGQARRAAQACAEANKLALSFRKLKKSQIAISMAAGLAMPLLTGSVWLLTAPPDGASPASVASAAAQTPADATTLQKQAYEAAMRLLDAGRTGEGSARMRRLAEGGYAPAQYRVSKFYEHGHGAPRNLGMARQWAERAARGGNSRAMHDVGVFFAQGEGGPRNEALAFRWFREAASFGVADSQYNLALLYEQGRGVAANASEALFWYLVAARHGDPNAADRAVALAAQLEPSGVEQARARARAFQAREPNAAANGA